jgi:hypothetical protein
MWEVLEIALEVALPSWARVDAGLRLPVFFVTVKPVRPISGRRVGGRGRSRRVRWGRDICPFKWQGSIGRKGGDGRRWCDESFNLLCSRQDH